MKNFHVVVLSGVVASGLLGVARGQDQLIYTDSLQSGWEDYGWAPRDYASSTRVHSGVNSISVTPGPYEALYLHHTAQNTASYASLRFWINGGAKGGQNLQVQAQLAGAPQSAYPVGPLPANTWVQVTIPLESLHAAFTPYFDGFWLVNATGLSQSTFHVDDIRLIAGTAAVSTNPAISVSVKCNANVHAISPLIYGVSIGSKAKVTGLKATVNRLGGNSNTRYNWLLNADNRGNDYFFESLADTSAVAGYRADQFIGDSQAAGAAPMITIPMIPWVAKLGTNRGKLASFSVAKYGAQTATDPYMPDAGNGILSNGSNVVGNDPNDANVPNNTAFQRRWINHLVSRWGVGQVKYYILNNEPSIWFSTHRDVAPTGLKMEQIKTSILNYSAQVKAADPGALVVAPEEWGWYGYHYSGYDQQYGSSHGFTNYPDRAAHGGMAYLPWLLQQIRKNDLATGKRSLDVFSVHYYPQSGEFGGDISLANQLLRNESTRELWDPNYISKSYIAENVRQIPLLKEWVKLYYPGTKTALTEYNWGAEEFIGGATAQADILGILGREGLDLATRWTTPAKITPTYLAMKLYRNYDGNGSSFGDTSVAATVPNPDNLSAFAALRSTDGALTVMVVCKALTGKTPLTLNLGSFIPATNAQVWQLTSANLIKHLPDLPPTASTLKMTLPAQSITLLVIPKK